MEKSFIKEAGSVLTNAKRFAFGFLILCDPVVYLLLFFFLRYEFQVLLFELFGQASQNPFVFEQFQGLDSSGRVPILSK